MFLGEAAVEELIGADPCRRPRITFAGRPGRPHATADEVVVIYASTPATPALMMITVACIGPLCASSPDCGRPRAVASYRSPVSRDRDPGARVPLAAGVDVAALRERVRRTVWPHDLLIAGLPVVARPGAGSTGRATSTPGLPRRTPKP